MDKRPLNVLKCCCQIIRQRVFECQINQIITWHFVKPNITNQGLGTIWHSELMIMIAEVHFDGIKMLMPSLIVNEHNTLLEKFPCPFLSKKAIFRTEEAYSWL